MLKCSKLVNQRREIENEIYTELENKGISTGVITYDDVCIVDMIQFGHISSKKRIEEDLLNCLEKTKKEIEIHGKRKTY